MKNLSNTELLNVNGGSTSYDKIEDVFLAVFNPFAYVAKQIIKK